MIKQFKQLNAKRSSNFICDSNNNKPSNSISGSSYESGTNSKSSGSDDDDYSTGSDYDDSSSSQGLVPPRRHPRTSSQRFIDDIYDNLGSNIRSKNSESLHQHIEDPPIRNNSLLRSPIKGWQRYAKKHTFNDSLNLSPVKPIYCHVQPAGVNGDFMFYGYAWILSMSEQFYYDTVVQFLSKSLDESTLKNILINNYQAFSAENFLNNLDNIVKLGEGAFGEVVKAENTQTDEIVAIKVMLKPRSVDEFNENTQNVLNYIQERKYLMQAYNSPFILKFKRSFQESNTKALFLVFEYCIFDLEKYCAILSDTLTVNIPEIWLLKNSNNRTLATDLNEIINELNVNIFEINIIWSFELFCILDFLGKCNLVHRDIKLANILIGPNGHLKLGDFGLINNTHFILREEQTNLHHLDLLDEMDNKENEGFDIAGTDDYFDMDAALTTLKMYHPSKYYKVTYDHNFIDHPNYELPDEDTFKMNSLSDIWAVGCVISELMFFGQRFWDPVVGIKIVKKMLGFKPNDVLWNIANLFYIRSNYDKYIMTGMLKYCRDTYFDLTDLLITFFSPRNIRARNYTKPFTHTNWYSKQPTRIIDLELIKKMQIFKYLKLNEHNVLTYQFSDQFFNLIKSDNKDTPMELEEWLHELKDERRRSDEKLFHFEPGCSVQWE